MTSPKQGGPEAGDARSWEHLLADVEADLQRVSRIVSVARDKLHELHEEGPAQMVAPKSPATISTFGCSPVADEGARPLIHRPSVAFERGDQRKCASKGDQPHSPHSLGLPNSLPPATRFASGQVSTPAEDDEISVMSASHMLTSAFSEGGQAPALQLPRALAERSLKRDKEQVELSPFAPVPSVLASNNLVHMPSMTKIRKPLSSQSNHRMKILKLHALWEEAYALVDAEEVRPFGPGTSRRTTVKKNLSLRTGDLSLPGWGPCRDSLANPHSKSRLCWDLLALLLICYDCALIPVEVAWSLPSKGSGTPTGVVAMEIAYWALDMVLNFFSGFYDQARLVWNASEIRRHYLLGWFPFDLMMLLLDVMVLIARGEEVRNLVEITTWARLIRMMRIVKLRRIAQKFEEVCSAWNHRGAALLHAVVYTFALVFLLTHSIACAWYYVGQRSRKDGFDSWLYQDNVLDAKIFEQYLLCFHWVLGQFTPAPIPIVPANHRERGFTIFVILFSLFVIGKGIQRISQTVQELNAARYDDDRLRRKVRQFLTVNKVPMELALRTTKFVDSVLSRRSAVQLDDTLVSEHLRKELITYQRERFLSRHVLFQSVFEGYPEVTSNVCEALQMQTYDKGRTVFTVGSLARCMYITTQGSFELDLEDGMTETFHDINYFAEVSLYATFLHVSSLTAVSFSDLFTFTATDFKRCVAQYPSCSGLIIEYATAILQRLRRDESMIKDNLNEVIVRQAFEATQFFKMTHLQDGLDLRTQTETTKSSSLRVDKVPTETVHSFLSRVRTRALSDADVASACAQAFPELDVHDGVFAKMNGSDERVRTLVSMVNALWLWRDNYDAFCAPQQEEVRLPQSLWRKLQLFIRWAGVTEELMHATLVMIIVRGMGNLQPLTKTLGSGAARPTRASKHIVEIRHPLAPSVQLLSEHWLEQISDVFDVHESFNLGQFMEGENLPSNVLQLQDMLKHRGDGLLKLYLFAVVAVMSGRDARGDVKVMQEEAIPGSRFMDDRRGRLIVFCLEALQHILLATPQTIYWSYMSWRAAALNLRTSTTTDLALARLVCLSRSHTASEVHQLYAAWACLEAVDRETLTDCLLADGIVERSVRFSMLPMCLANARANSVVGLSALFVVLAELLGMLKSRSFWTATDAMTLTLDLADLASFTSAVSHSSVFATCLLRADLRQVGSRVNVVMTSRNWVRAADTDSAEVEMQAHLHAILVQQRSMEKTVQELSLLPRRGGSSNALNGADARSLSVLPPQSNHGQSSVRKVQSMPLTAMAKNGAGASTHHSTGAVEKGVSETMIKC